MKRERNTPVTKKKHDSSSSSSISSSKKTKYSAEKVLNYLNQKCDRNYKNTDLIIARLKEGRTVDECFRIIDIKFQDPYFLENPKYFSPTTLFRKSHFDTYLNEKPEDYEHKDDDWKRRFLDRN